MSRNRPYRIRKDEIEIIRIKACSLLRTINRTNTEGLNEPHGEESSSYADLIDAQMLVKDLSERLQKLREKADINRELA